MKLQSNCCLPLRKSRVSVQTHWTSCFGWTAELANASSIAVRKGARPEWSSLLDIFNKSRSANPSWPVSTCRRRSSRVPTRWSN